MNRILRILSVLFVIGSKLLALKDQLKKGMRVVRHEQMKVAEDQYKLENEDFSEEEELDDDFESEEENEDDEDNGDDGGVPVDEMKTDELASHEESGNKLPNEIDGQFIFNTFASDNIEFVTIVSSYLNIYFFGFE